MRERTTDELIRRAQAADHAAFEQLSALVAKRFYATASLILRDPDAANDAVQETLIDIWRDIRALRDVAMFDAWARRILVRRCYRQARQNRRRRVEVRVLEIDEPTVAHEASIGDSDALERAFRRLSTEHRAVLILHHRDGLELAETADALGIPIGTVKSRLNRATAALRAAMEAENRPAQAMGSAA
jgi:RNA polymerase sigma-70 factor (ECF subfamily)